MRETRRGALLSDRLLAMQGVRFVAGGATALTLLALPDLGPSRWPAVPALLGWLVVTTIAEVLRRSAPHAGQPIASAVLTLDVLVLGVVITRTGAFASPLLGLVYLHVVAVSLLLSHRAGMRVAVLHGLALIGGFVVALSGRFEQLQLSAGTSVSNGARVAGVHAGAFLAVAIGVTVFSAMNEHVVRRSHRDLSLLAGLGRTLGGVSGPEDTLAAAASALRSGLDADRAVVAVIDGSTCRAAARDRVMTTWTTTSHPLAAIEALEQTELVHEVRDVDERFLSLLPADRNVIVVPVELDDAVIGVILVAIGGNRRRQVPESTVRVVEQVGRLVASAIDRARLHAELERMATTDPLTGLANRRTFDGALLRELERARRSGDPVSLVVLDIDHFKRVNDEHGHDTGDAVLRQFARQLAMAAREADLPARFGGEEFVVLLPMCGIRDAADAADRLRRMAVLGDMPIPITASAGVATFDVDAMDATGLFAAADTALYRAKRSGRNRTVPASPSGRRRLVAVAS